MPIIPALGKLRLEYQGFEAKQELHRKTLYQKPKRDIYYFKSFSLMVRI
jgi:hypothetical protein